MENTCCQSYGRLSKKAWGIQINSAYEFKSFMNTIKKSLHNHFLPLQQLHRRTVEIYKSESVFSPHKKNSKTTFQIVQDINGEKNYASIWYEDTFISTDFKDT